MAKLLSLFDIYQVWIYSQVQAVILLSAYSIQLGIFVASVVLFKQLVLLISQGLFRNYDDYQPLVGEDIQLPVVSV